MYLKNNIWLNYLRPNTFVRDISNINLNLLKKSGIRLIVCDLDNTLVPHFNKFPNRYVYEFVQEIKKHNFIFIVASNNTKKRVSTFCNKLNENIEIDGYIYNSKKPFVRKVKKYLSQYNIPMSDIVVIGDQFITDVFLANRLKTKSILVLPKVEVSKSNSINFFQRFLENIIYKNLQHEEYIEHNFEDKVVDNEIELL